MKVKTVVFVVAVLAATGGFAMAENIDPANDGSKYAWAENLGWVNARPGGPGGPGVQISDSDLTGWAWSENTGWINFAPTGAGVTINPTTGIFSGRAWSENAGRISFSSAGPNQYRAATIGTAAYEVPRLASRNVS